MVDAQPITSPGMAPVGDRLFGIARGQEPRTRWREDSQCYHGLVSEERGVR